MPAMMHIPEPIISPPCNLASLRVVGRNCNEGKVTNYEDERTYLIE